MMIGYLKKYQGIFFLRFAVLNKNVNTTHIQTWGNNEVTTKKELYSYNTKISENSQISDPTMTRKQWRKKTNQLKKQSMKENNKDRKKIDGK